MLTKTRALVLRKIPYTDHSVIAKVFTEDCGLLSFIVQGVQKSKTHNAYFQPGNFLEIVFNLKNDGGLNRVKETRILNTENGIPHPVLLQIQQFYLELLSVSLQENQPENALFVFLVEQWNNLKTTQSWSYHPIIFTLGLCRQLGYDVHWNSYRSASSTNSNIVAEFAPNEGIKQQPAWMSIAINRIQDGQDLQLSRMERRDLLNALVQHLQFHAFPNKALKSLEIIDEINS